MNCNSQVEDWLELRFLQLTIHAYPALGKKRINISVQERSVMSIM
jgi:hypothetical protein